MANGTLSDELLSFWLHQDRIYAAYTYPPFIGSLIANLFFSRALQSDVNHSQHILKVLVLALQNIMQEVEFFENTATKWGLNINGWNKRKGTRDYKGMW